MPTVDDEETTIVPAAAGFTAVVIWVGQPPPGKRPAEADVYSQAYPVCAWRIHRANGWAEPILPEPVLYPSIVMNQLPDGKLLEVNGGIYDNLNEARLRVLYSAQLNWDQANGPKGNALSAKGDVSILRLQGAVA